MITKVCGLNDPSNISEIDACNPALLGFIFHPQSPRFLGDTEIPKTKAQRVGVFVNSTIPFIEKNVAKHHLDYLQLHGTESSIEIKKLHQLGYKIIKSISVNSEINLPYLREIQPYCSFFLFDTKGSKPGGNGIKFDWTLLEQYQLNTPFMLSGGIQPADLSILKKINHPYLAGVDINSGFEISPGIKNKTIVKKFLDGINN